MGRGAEGDEDLHTALRNLLASNEELEKENRLFESHLQRVTPNASAAEEDESAKGKKGGKGKAAVKTPVKQPRSLTSDDKYEITSAEVEVCNAEIENLKNEGEKQLDELKALLEETDMRISETKKETYEFKRDIVVGAENFRTGKTVAEKMMRYMEGTTSNKEALIEKLRLKNATIKSQIQKLEQQLQQKEEMGEVLHVIDFDQLKIENQQYLEKIEERNNELLRLKLTTGKTVQVLNKLKKKLGELTSQGEWLRSETAARKVQLSKFEADIERVREELKSVAKVNKFVRQEQEDQDKPQALEYIRLKSEVAELEKKKADWLRKLEILNQK